MLAQVCILSCPLPPLSPFVTVWLQVWGGTRAEPALHSVVTEQQKRHSEVKALQYSLCWSVSAFSVLNPTIQRVGRYSASHDLKEKRNSFCTLRWDLTTFDCSFLFCFLNNTERQPWELHSQQWWMAPPRRLSCVRGWRQQGKWQHLGRLCGLVVLQKATAVLLAWNSLTLSWRIYPTCRRESEICLAVVLSGWILVVAGWWTRWWLDAAFHCRPAVRALTMGGQADWC